jgi:hypothetical protein
MEILPDFTTGASGCRLSVAKGRIPLVNLSAPGMIRARELKMKKLIAMVIAAALPGIAGCSSLPGSIGAPQTPSSSLSSRSTLGVKASSGVDVKENAMSIAKSTGNPSGVSETEAHFALYTARFGPDSSEKLPAVSSCEEAAAPMDASATLSRRTEPKKEGC